VCQNPDLDHQRVHEHHWVDAIERPALQILQFLDDGVGDPGNQVG
jgi:hypothetical protein